MSYFVDVIVPLSLPNIFTYSVLLEEFQQLQIGCRVIVPFGKSKYYTAIVVNKHQNPPVLYQAKNVYEIIDKTPKITLKQLELWQFVADYYLSNLGEVYSTAVPSLFILENETIVYLNIDKTLDISQLTDEEFVIYEALELQPILKIHEIQAILGKNRVYPLIEKMSEKGIVRLYEETEEKYKPKTEKYVVLPAHFQSDDALRNLIDEVARTEKQKKLLFTYFQMVPAFPKGILVKDLLEKAEVSQAVFKNLVEKGIFEISEQSVYRVQMEDAYANEYQLSTEQQTALNEIETQFREKDTVLLHGITGSGKTEIYFQLIENALKNNQQILFLVPEITLTTQLVQRLNQQFRKEVMVYHSKYSPNERYEVWMRMLEKPMESKIIIGTRSSVFLPFTDLGLVIVDEEHDTSYKQHDPAPRYHARDMAVVLAKSFKAKLLMGSATPSIESYYNCLLGKYRKVMLNKRYNDVPLPKMHLIDIKEAYKQKAMVGHFSTELIDAINQTLSEGKQVVIYQNRRGFSPVLECGTCGYVPQCTQCDVSLTYYKSQHKLKCHYCGFSMAYPKNCMVCKTVDISTKGVGTEQIEEEMLKLFPQYSIARIDQDTTKRKYALAEIIEKYKNGAIDIIVGTQMITKGLDFDNVGLVGVLNVDNSLYFPDFRAHERAFQTIVQVAGRAGRKQQGKVYLQTYNPFHNVVQQIVNYDYEQMFKEQMFDRHNFHYPPYFRLIHLQFRHVDFQRVKEASQWMVEHLKQKLQIPILGPEEPTINRIKNLYLRNVMIKVPANASLLDTKKHIQRSLQSFENISQFKSVRVVINVDFY